MKKFSIKENKEILCLIIILLFAFFLRLYSLGTPPFWIDESISSTVSSMILQKGLPILDSGWFYGGAYVFHYIQAFFLYLFMNEFGARLFSVLAGVLTVLLAYFIGREYSKSGGIISALFMSVFYLEVLFSRQARYYQFFQLIFFLSIYLLYKSRANPKCLYLALISFFITLDTKIAGLILAPFFILHILIYNKSYKKYFAILLAMPLITRFIPVLNLSSGSTESFIDYAGKYAAYTSNVLYILILFIPGIIWAFFKNKRLTLLIVLPSLVALTGIFSLEIFAMRYIYFFAFPLVLYSSLLLSFLYEEYGKIMLITIFVLLIVPSNIFIPFTGVNILTPISHGYYDNSAPTTDYKSLPEDLMQNLKSNITLISYFSSDVEWYIKKPNYVLPFSMNGIGEDQISINNPQGELVDRYSGALILKEIPDRPYYVTADYFSVSKLKPSQRSFLTNLTKNCSAPYGDNKLLIYLCEEIE